MLLLLGPVRVLPGDAVAPPGVLPVLDPAAGPQGYAVAGGGEVEDAGGRLGEQGAVMGDERRSAGMLLHSTGEVREPPGIEMVRRLIEQEQLAPRSEPRGEPHPVPLPDGQPRQRA